MSAVKDVAPDGRGRRPEAGTPVVTGPLRIAVTGGIGAGKSTLSGLLVDRGAVLIDSDRLAREVVEPGTPGLAAVAEAFGPSVLGPDGALDRAALAAVVFADPAARAALERITHPLVRAAAAERAAAATDDAVVVNDIPILRELAVAATFHLVVGIGAEDEVRVRRLVGRGMTEDDARARIAAQISDDERRTLCDVWLDNEASPDTLAATVAALWDERLRPFADNRRAGCRARRGPAALTDSDPEWPMRAMLLAARVSAAAGGLPVEHIGSTAVPGLAAKDVLDLQLLVPDLATADRLEHPLTEAGFPRVAGIDRDNPHPDPAVPGSSDPAAWAKRLHGNADPGQSVNLHLRVRDAANRRHALLFRDWLRADAGSRSEYLAVKRQTSVRFAADSDSARYAQAKEPWFDLAAPRAERWARDAGWRLPDQP